MKNAIKSVRAGVLIERLKAYEPELPKDMEPMVYVNYCEKSEFNENEDARRYSTWIPKL